MDSIHSIQELIDRTAGMPLERMRFFINEDRQEPRCFGIYQDPSNGHWVVYKNKSDGSRAVRYSGPDEGYAANELWMKIQSEIELRRKKYDPKERRKQFIIPALLGVAFVVVLIAFLIVSFRSPHRGYYTIDDGVYYYQDSSWYYYDDDYDDWVYYDTPGDYDWYHDNYYGDTYPGLEQNFEDSEYYVEPSDDDDDDSSIFSGWDSSDTDWDSDW